jgi:hypothetical protein
LRISVEVLKSLKKTAPFAFVGIGFTSHIILANTRIMAVFLSALLGFFFYIWQVEGFLFYYVRGGQAEPFTTTVKKLRLLTIQCYGPMMLIPDVGPGFFLFGSRTRISDPGSNNKKEEGKKLFSCLSYYLFCSNMFKKIENLINLNKYRKLFESLGKRIQVFLTQNIVSKLSENMDPESRGPKYDRICDPDLQHCVTPYSYSVLRILINVKFSFRFWCEGS